MAKYPEPWIPITDKLELAVLGKTIEELSELTKVLARIIIQGMDGIDPNTGEDNGTALVNEIADVEALLAYLKLSYTITEKDIKKRKAKKSSFLRKWLDLIEEKRDNETS